MATTAKIEGKKLIITMDLQTPTLSKSQKTLIVAGTSGFTSTNAQVDGKNVKLSVNAYIDKD